MRAACHTGAGLTLLATALALGACDLDGDDLIYPGASLYQAPDLSFHFHYLSPPWRHEETDAQQLAYLVVDDTNQYDHSGDITISHKLFVRFDTTAPERAARTRMAAASKQGMTISHEVAPFETRTGEQGFQYQAYRDEGADRFYYRDALISARGGRTVLFKLIAAYASDEQEIDDLIYSFSAGPDDGTPTPGRVPEGGGALTADGGAP